jgi:mono/diheme cytochrome c family protein
MSGRRVFVLLGLLAVVGGAVAVAWPHADGGGRHGVAAAVHSSTDRRIAMGGHLFVQFGCSACHGLQGRGGVSPDVPSLKSAGNGLTVAQLASIIDQGRGESANPKKPFMPVWGPVISKTQVTDLVAYIRAGLPRVPQADPVPVSRNQGPAVAGAALFVRYGCINCHGPNGLGGVPNPQAPTRRSHRSRVRTSVRSSTPTRRSSR